MRFRLFVFVAFLTGCASDTTRFGPESDLVNAMDAIKRVSPEQAQTLVRSAKYPPDGRRGAAFGISHHDYRSGDIQTTMQSANRQQM